MKGHILLIEDDTAFQGMLREALEERGYRVTAVNRAEDGVRIVRSGDFDLVLTDVMLSGISGVEAIPRLREAAPGTDIVVMTAFSTRELALEAVKLGAYDFFSKPFSLKELDIVIRRAMEKRRMQGEIVALRETLRRDTPTSRIVGESRAMRDVKALLERIAPLESTVLIMGESGTGKELIADTIRALSPRAANPFVKVNCAAIPEHLFENELFGHEKGAFTGAATAMPGKFEQAQGGMIMLDEIGDMPLAIQPKLLRVVEQKQVERLGGRAPVPLDVRIIAATNQNLAERVREKAFREDLYYRLSVAVVLIPPLRDRKDDIPLLAQYFVNKLEGTLGLPVHGLSPDAIAVLMDHDWPGNVRQLANVLERAAIAADGLICARDVMAAIGTARGSNVDKATLSGMDLKTTLRMVERNLILDALRRCHGRQTEAAVLLGLTPKNLWAKLRKHGIRAGTEDLLQQT